MPERGIPRNPFIQEVREKWRQTEGDQRRSDYSPGHDSVPDAAKKFHKEVIGHGGETAVIPYEGKSGKVIAFNYFDLSPYKAKRSFYLQRIFHTLFPHNFPRFYAAFGHDDRAEQMGMVPGTVRERVTAKASQYNYTNYTEDAKEVRKLTKFVLALVKRKSVEALKPVLAHIQPPEPTYPLELVRETIKGLQGVRYPEVILDKYISNSQIGDDGGEYYLDVIDEFGLLGEDGLRALVSFAEEHNYSEQDRNTIKNAVERVVALQKETPHQRT